jgi:DNA-binding NtrC family response regulator
MQVQLLRALETQQFTRVGGSQTIHVNIRLICATNKDLEKAVETNSFREDLYYRINVFTIVLPPLRDRRSDIPLLVDHFVKKYANAMNKPINKVSSEAMDALISHDWPGNVRELENAIERSMVVGKSPEIQVEDLPFQFSQMSTVGQIESDSLAAAEKKQINQVLDKTNWNISKAAELLEIDRVTLYNKIKKYELRK